MRRNHPSVLAEIRDTGRLGDETIQLLTAPTEDFKGQFALSTESSAAARIA